MRRYEILGHTADLRLKVEGDSLPELFSAALEGMANVMKVNFCSNPAGTEMAEEVILSAVDATTLLIDFLSEVLTRSYQKKVVFCSTQFKYPPSNNSGRATVKAKIFGFQIDGFDEDIKAVTYHEANIIKNAAGNYETNLVFDI